MNKNAYVCLNPVCNQESLFPNDKGLLCPKCSKHYSYYNGTQTPIFECQDENLNEYSIQDAVQIHDNSLKWLFSTFYSTEDELRQKLVKRLNIKSGDRILITGAGGGNDIPYIAEAINFNGEIYAQDIAKEMLIEGEKRIRKSLNNKLSEGNLNLYFSASDAVNLPFQDDFFDAAYHFGGINLFENPKKGISEMYRVVKENGRMLIGDEGVAPWLRNTEVYEILINNTELYRYEPPINLLPLTARDVELTWELCNAFYVITFTVSRKPLEINIDTPHVGKRGGSMRTRYYGKLEGIDCDIKNEIYLKAKELGVSRVELIEELLRKSLKNL